MKMEVELVTTRTAVVDFDKLTAYFVEEWKDWVAQGEEEVSDEDKLDFVMEISYANGIDFFDDEWVDKYGHVDNIFEIRIV